MTLTEDQALAALGVSVVATDEEVRAAYIRLAAENHPDKNPDNAAALAKFVEVSQALKVLLPDSDDNDEDDYYEDDDDHDSEDEDFQKYVALRQFDRVKGKNGNGAKKTTATSNNNAASKNVHDNWLSDDDGENRPKSAFKKKESAATKKKKKKEEEKKKKKEEQAEVSTSTTTTTTTNLYSDDDDDGSNSNNYSNKNNKNKNNSNKSNMRTTSPVSSRLSSTGSGSTTTAANTSSTDLKSNLSVLVEMGFEKKRAKTALALSAGDLNGAMARLLTADEPPAARAPSRIGLEVVKNTPYTIARGDKPAAHAPSSASSHKTGSDMLKKLRESSSNRIDPNEVEEVGFFSLPLSVRNAYRKPCMFFSSGKCQKGDQCTYSHYDMESASGAFPSAYQQRQLAEQQQEQLKQEQQYQQPPPPPPPLPSQQQQQTQHHQIQHKPSKGKVNAVPFSWAERHKKEQEQEQEREQDEGYQSQQSQYVLSPLSPPLSNSSKESVLGQEEDEEEEEEEDQEEEEEEEDYIEEAEAEVDWEEEGDEAFDSVPAAPGLQLQSQSQSQSPSRPIGSGGAFGEAEFVGEALPRPRGPMWLDLPAHDRLRLEPSEDQAKNFDDLLQQMGLQEPADPRSTLLSNGSSPAGWQDLGFQQHDDTLQEKKHQEELKLQQRHHLLEREDQQKQHQSDLQKLQQQQMVHQQHIQQLHQKQKEELQLQQLRQNIQQEQAQQQAKVALMKQHALVVAYEQRLADQQDQAREQHSLLQAKADALTLQIKQSQQKQQLHACYNKHRDNEARAIPTKWEYRQYSTEWKTVMKQVFSGVTKGIRSAGQALDSLGKQFELNPNVDTLLPSTRMVKLGKKVPVVKDAYIASSATVIGSVNIGPKSSVWYGSVVRGDVNTITIGEGVTIGDRCMVHCSGRAADSPTKIGNNVVVGSGSIVHGSTVGNNCWIGEGAQLLDGSQVGDNSIIAAGAFVSAGKVVPSGQLWSGVPAAYERDLLKEEIAKITATAAENVKLAEQHALENAKTWSTIEEEEFDYFQVALRNDDYHRRLTPAEWSQRLGDVQGYAVPGRILDSPIAAHTFPESRPDDEADYLKKLP